MKLVKGENQVSRVSGMVHSKDVPARYLEGTGGKSTSPASAGMPDKKKRMLISAGIEYNASPKQTDTPRRSVKEPGV